MTNHPPTPYGAPPPKVNTARNILIIAVVAVLVLCLAAIAIAAATVPDDDKPNTLSAQDRANRSAAAATTTAPAPPPATSSAPTTTSPAPAPTTTKPKPTTEAPIVIGDGTYRVGEDIPPGRYKVTERADEFCYWSRTKNDNIIDNSIAGGFPQFTAKNGEDVEIQGCPEFQRQGSK